MKAYSGVEVQLHAFLISALEGDEYSASHPGRFNHRERDPGTDLIGGWMGPRADLDALVRRKILAPTGARTLDHPARMPHLYHRPNMKGTIQQY
jgi:hypothetical protein